MNMLKIAKVNIALYVIFLFFIASATCSYSQEKWDTLPVYALSKQFLAKDNFAFYKYGNIKPRHLKDAFCVFLTGDEDLLKYFKKLEFEAAVDYAMNRENNLMRYDWGCESFMDFSKFMIRRFNLWAPYLQYRMAVQCFHIWMNFNEPDFELLSKNLCKTHHELNKMWKSRYYEFSKYANNEHLKGKSKRKYQRFVRKSRACSL
jgi:hypothetical protein